MGRLRKIGFRRSSRCCANSIDEQGDLAEVYVACGERQNYPQDFTAAMDALKPFLQSPTMGAPQWLTYAGAAAGKGDAADR